MTRFDVTSFGESMIRLSVPAGERLEATDRLDVHAAGAESNVMSALARLGHRCGWVSALPQNPLGRLIESQLRRAGVDLSAVHRSAEGRLGTYYVEFAVPPRSIQVVYDRAGSCVTTLQPEQVDWDYLLDTRLIHLTGITPPLSSDCAAIVAEAIERARAAGVAVSFDVNYRGKLWSPRAARDGLQPLMQGVDLLLCSKRDAEQLFACHGAPRQIVEQLAQQFRARQVVVSLADQGVIGWDGDRFHTAAARPVQIVDRIGAGDALAAGVIHGWLQDDLEKGLHVGALMAALALSQHGDMVITSLQEVEALLAAETVGVAR